MRGRTFLLTFILFSSLISPVFAGDVVTTENTAISGNHTMTGNYTVSHGTTLELKPGAIIDMGEYWMKVEGTLLANNATIMSSEQSVGSGGHNAGVWDSITVVSTGDATLDNVTISNAKSCLIIDGALTATNLILEHCLIGVEVAGTADITGLTASHIDHDGVRVTGTADLSEISMTNIGAGISSSGDLTLSLASFDSIGTAVSLTGGSADVDDLTFTSGINTGVSIASGVTGDVSGMIGSVGTAIVAIDATGFTISNLNLTGSRLVNSWSAGDLTLTNVIFDANSPETVIDVRTSSTFTIDGATITGSFSASQNSFDAPWIAVSLAGSGEHKLSNMDIEASSIGITASGTGSLTLNDSTIHSDDTGIEMSGMAISSLNNVILNISNGGSHGIDLLQGLHSMSDIEINMPYNPSESSSTGLEVWWATVDATSITINGFATSMELHDTIFEADDLTAWDSNDEGIMLQSSSVFIRNSFDSRISDSAVTLIDASIIHAHYWNATLHETPLIVGEGSTATLWQWSPSLSSDEDATGEGTLYFGTTALIDTSVTTSIRLYENVVNFEDLVDNPIDAEWSSLGFSGTASTGIASLPITTNGNNVVATYGGIGASKMLTGTVGGIHTIKVPIIPIGDWVITTGTDVVLGSTADGSPHTAGGNITVQNGASLRIVDGTLIIPQGSTLDVKIGASLSGSNSEIIGEIISPGSQGINPSVGDDLLISGNLSWDCQSPSDSYGLNIMGDLSLGPSCDVTIYSGSVSMGVNVQTGASLTIKNTLIITVLDKGDAVAGATVNVQGMIATTDSEGIATLTLDSRNTDTSGTTWAGAKFVEMHSGDLPDYLLWDTNFSRTYTFMASTVTGGELTEWLVLEKVWSPYHLSDNLIIPHGQTMSVYDGVELHISEAITIEVNGILNIGSATLSSVGSGARWGGLIIGDNVETEALLLGTHLVEGTPLITMDGQSKITISNAIIARSSSTEPLIQTTINSAGQITIINSALSDSGAECVSTQGAAFVTMFETSMESCGDVDLWMRGNQIDLTNVSLEGGADLAFVTGIMSNIVSTGDIEVSNIDGLLIENLVLAGTISGIDNREMVIDTAHIVGAPGIEFDATAGTIGGATIDCNGSGVGMVVHHGRASAPLIVSDSSISGCSKGIDLHSDGEPMDIEFHSVNVQATTAVASDGYGFIFYGGQLSGSVDVTAATGNLFDVVPTSSSADGGELWMWTNHIFDVRLNDAAYSADLNIQIDVFSWQTSVSGTSILQPIPHTVVAGNMSQSSNTAALYATSEGLPQLNALIGIGPDFDQIIVIDLIANQAPSVEIIKPDDGDRVMESEELEIRAVISDDITFNSELIVSWSVIQGNDVIMQLSGEWNNITDLSAGIYVLKLEVTDEQGQVGMGTVSFEVTLLDSDGDWGPFCDSETWFDDLNSRKCGPDIEDSDDDNDGIYDVVESHPEWTTDPCASIDSDGDGQPDKLHCPVGVTTWLVEDPDDDGDGHPDITDAYPNDPKMWDSAEANEGMNSTVLIFLFAIIAAAAFILLRKRRE